MIHHYVDKVVVLTHRPRIDRRYLFDKAAKENGLDYVYFYAIEDSNPKRSFNLSQRDILTIFADTDLETFLVMEDDADLRNLDLIEPILSELPNDWDMLYLGANVKPHPDFIPPIRVSQHLFRIFNAFTTHAIIYTHKAVEQILDAYDGEQMYDAFLDAKMLRNLNAYVCSPFLSYQRPGMSDLWERTVDYTDTFQASENYLNNLP
jgi:hypothetical protein